MATINELLQGCTVTSDEMQSFRAKHPSIIVKMLTATEHRGDHSTDSPRYICIHAPSLCVAAGPGAPRHRESHVTSLIIARSKNSKLQVCTLVYVARKKSCQFDLVLFEQRVVLLCNRHYRRHLI